MRILFVAMLESIHTVRWIRQIADQGWEILVFPSMETLRIHPALFDLNVKICHPYYPYLTLKLFDKHYGKGILHIAAWVWRSIMKRQNPGYYNKKLYKLIKRKKPNLIHTLETQGAGYLYDETIRKYKIKNRPLWWHTNWGSDIYLFGQLAEHAGRVKSVLASCNYYSCESDRDIELALDYGFKGSAFSPFPNTGGIDFSTVFDQGGKKITSSRKIVLLKGYQGWAGRALFGLKALELVADLLLEKGMTVLVYGNPKGEDIKIAVELFQKATGVKTELLKYINSHEKMLDLFVSSRIYLGLSISDGISTSLLEAMACGAYPIQSDTSTACEWIEDGISGSIVPPDDVTIIADRLRLALTEDDYINSAVELNYVTIQQRLNHTKIKNTVIEMYRKVHSEAKRG